LLKQVTVVRRDLKMRRGKEIAQGGHGYMAFLTKAARRGRLAFIWNAIKLCFDREAWPWLTGGYAKIALQLPPGQGIVELCDLEQAAYEAGLRANLVIDSGKTEFGGVSTVTMLTIGPNDSEKIDRITGHLELY